MPEILTRHPDVVMNLLRKHGIVCGKGGEQNILKKCPQASFCDLEGGELCVYGLDQFAQMTQIKLADICPGQRSRAPVSHGFSFVAGCLVTYLFFKRAHLKKYF